MFSTRLVPLITTQLLLLLFVNACATTQTSDALLDYTSSAEGQFVAAMEEFVDEDCIEAEQMFADLRRDFPYSSYAVLAELRIADCRFISGAHAEAAIAYQQFIKTHPTHPDASYASYRRAVSYFEMIPGDWFLLPPPHERDQSATRDARAAFAGYITSFPQSTFIEAAREYLRKVEDALVRHELYVAKFYLSRGNRRAATVRLEGIPSAFPQSQLVPDAMFLRATTLLRMKKIDTAREVFHTIITMYPEHYQARRAKDYLTHLDETGAKGGSNG